MERNEQLKRYAQELRKNMTKEENLLWYRFLRHYDVQFRRQCPFGRYIADFYCAKARLIVELDGSQHYDPQTAEYDRLRTAYLGSLDLKVLRFSNSDVLERFDGVCQAIHNAVQERYSAAPVSIGTGRRALSTHYYSRAESPHPPPAGAPSPQDANQGLKPEKT